jgi:hypothetical protein
MQLLANYFMKIINFTKKNVFMQKKRRILQVLELTEIKFLTVANRGLGAVLI